MPKIATNFVYPPIPVRDQDWCAHYDDEEGPTGWGETEAEAINDLITNYPPPCVDGEQEGRLMCQQFEGERKFLAANVDRQKSRKEAKLQFTARERAMILKLEMIATGRTGGGPSLDLEIARNLAAEALQEIGWPSVRHMQKDAKPS